MLKKIGIEKVVPLLPEVGDSLLAKARKIEELLDAAALLVKQAEDHQGDLEADVQEQWSTREIQKATKQAVKAATTVAR